MGDAIGEGLEKACDDALEKVRRKSKAPGIIHDFEGSTMRGVGDLNP